MLLDPQIILIDWDSITTVFTEPSYYQRTIRETVEIQQEEGKTSKEDTINQEADQYVKTTAWQPLLKKMNLNKNFYHHNCLLFSHHQKRHK